MTEPKKRAILVNVSADKSGDEVLEELECLADTAGYECVATLTQRREKADKSYYIGKGKLAELKELVDTLEAETVIFDNDVSGSQFFNLETALDVDVIDRATVILEIFASRAVTNEGKMQVNLAQKKKLLPRAIGQGVVLSRQGGGGGGGGGARRGAGEQQQELDKRVIRKDIQDLEKKIAKLGEERALRREKRKKSAIKIVAIVGYTNAGKSTLMNVVTKAGVLEEDKLFATLDPVSRKIWLDIGKEFLLVDTVGFISRLPHEFVSAFKSTLEEAKYADLILHVADGSNEKMLQQYDVVCEVLDSLGVVDTPTILVINKSDKGEPECIPNVEHQIAISAKNQIGVDALKNKISELLFPEN